MPSIKNCLGLLGTLALQALATEHEVASAVCAESNLRNLGVAIKAQDASDGLQNVVNMLQVFHQQVDGQGQSHGGNSSDAESAPDADPRVSLTISASADPRLFQQYSESSVAIVEPETKLEVTVDHTGWASASNVDVSLASASNVAFRDISSGGVGRRHRPNGTSAVNSSFPDKTANQTHPIEVDTSQASKVFTESNASVYGTVANQTLQDEEEDDHSPIGWPSAPDRRLDFVHIPKNAGTAIENSGIEYGYRWGRFNKLLHGRRWTKDTGAVGNTCLQGIWRQWGFPIQRIRSVSAGIHMNESFLTTSISSSCRGASGTTSLTCQLVVQDVRRLASTLSWTQLQTIFFRDANP